MDLIPDGEIPCPRCGKMFNNLGKLKIHTSEHAGPKQKFECFACGKAYRSQELFEEHFDVHLKSGSGECDICHEKFETVKELRIHKLMHPKMKNPDEPTSIYKCIICDEGFSDFDVFKQHQASHAKPYEKYKCDFCCLCFAEEECLKTHMVQCKYEALVQNHDISKTQRNTKCPYCKKFLKTANLKRHVKMYCNPRKEARKVFFCKTCGKLYTSVISLRRHIKFYCKDIECKFCEKRFSNEEYLTAHLRTCKVLKLRETLQRIRDSGRYKCQICDETFDKRKFLLEHRRLHYRKPKRVTMLTFCAPATTVVADNNVFLPTYFNIVNGPDGKPVLAPMSNQIMILNPSQMMRNEDSLLTPKIEPPEVEETPDFDAEGNTTETPNPHEEEMEDDSKEIVLYDDSAEINPGINLEPIVELREGTEPYEETPTEQPPSPEPSQLVIAELPESGSPPRKALHECDMCEQTFTNRSALTKHYMKHEMDMLENLKNVTNDESASLRFI